MRYFHQTSAFGRRLDGKIGPIRRVSDGFTHKDHQRFLQLMREDIFYQFTYLSFGLASVPWVFTKLLKPVVSRLGSQGIWWKIYLDDILKFNPCKSTLLDHLGFIRSLIEYLGFPINEEKSKQIPCQKLKSWA